MVSDNFAELPDLIVRDLARDDGQVDLVEPSLPSLRFDFRRGWLPGLLTIRTVVDDRAEGRCQIHELVGGHKGADGQVIGKRFHFWHWSHPAN